MADTLGTLVVRIAADIKELEAGLNQAAGTTRTATSNMQSSLDSLEQKAISVAKGLAVLWVTDKAVEAVKEMAMLNARYEELGVVMTVVGRNAGYNATQMERYALETQNMGISMIESRNTVIQLAQAQIDLSDASKLARIAQDAAVLGNMNSSEALKAMIYGIKTGQTEVLKTIGIQVNFEASYKRLADQLGVSTTALSENQKMQARKNATMDEGAKLVGAYEAAMGTAAKQIKSMERYTEDLKVMQGQVFNEALTLGVMAFTEHLKDANGTVTEMTKSGQLKEWASNITTVFATLVDAALNVVSILQTVGATTVWLANTAANTIKGGVFTPGGASVLAQREDNAAYAAMVADIWSGTGKMVKAMKDRTQALKDEADKQARIMADPSDRKFWNSVPKPVAPVAAVDPAVRATKVVDAYKKIQEDADKYISTLQKEADQLGMTDKEKALYNASSEAMTLHAGPQREAFMKSALALIDQADAYKTATKAAEELAKQVKAQADADTKAADGLHAEIVSLRDGNEALRLHNQEIGLSTEALNKLTLSRIDEQITIQQGVVNEYADTAARGGNVSGMQEQINKLDELNTKRGLTATGQVATGAAEQIKRDTEAQKKAADEVAAEYKHGWEETDRIGRETFIGLAVEGKTFAETVGKSLKTALAGAMYDLFARPLMLQIYTSVMGSGGAAGSALGTAGQAGSLYSAGSGLSTAGNYLGLTGPGSFTSGWNAGAAATTTANAGSAGLLTGNMDLMAGSAVTTTTNMEALGATVQGLTGSTSSLSTVMGGLSKTLGIVGLFIGAYALLTQDHGIPTQSTGSATSGYDALGNRTSHVTEFGGVTTADLYGTIGQGQDISQGDLISAGHAPNILNPANDKMVATMEAAYLTAAHSLGITAAAATFSYGGNTGKDNQNPNFALGGGIVGGSQFNTMGEKPLTDANLQDAASRAVFAALQGSTLPKYLQGVFDGMDASAKAADGAYKMTTQQIADVTTLAQSYADLHAQLQSLPFASLKDLSYAAAAGLVAAAGGMANLGASLGNYYTKFYSATEQTALLTKNTGDAFVNLGDVMPPLTVAGRDQYRAMVDAAAATVAQNDALGLVNAADSAHYTGLLNLATAYDTLNPALVTTALTVDQLAAALAKTQGLQLTEAQLMGDTAAAATILAAQREAEYAALGATDGPIQRHIDQLNDQKAAADAAATALANMTAGMDLASQALINTGVTTAYQVAQDAANAAWTAFKTAIPEAANMTVAQVAVVQQQISQGQHPEFSDKTVTAVHDFLVAANVWLPIQAAATNQTIAATAATSTYASTLATVAKTADQLLSDVSTAYANVQSALAGVGNAMQVLQNDQISAQQKVNDLTKSAASNLYKFAGTISDFLDTIDPATGPNASLASLKAQLSTTAVLAAGGDTAAQGKVISQAQAVMKALEASSTSALEYARGEAFVRNTLEPIQKSTTSQAADLLATLTTTMDGSGLDIAKAFGLTGDKATAMAGLLSNAGTASATLATLLAKPGAEAILLTGDFKSSGDKLALAWQVLNDANASYAAGLAAIGKLILPPITTDLDKLQIALTAYDIANTALATAVAATGLSTFTLASQLGLAGDAAAAFIAAVGTAQAGGTHTVTVPAPAPLVDMTAVTQAKALYAANSVAMAYNPNIMSAGATDARLQWLSDAISTMGLSAATAMFNGTVTNYAAAGGLPHLATGTNYLQSDGAFYGHAGETITPRPFVDIERNARNETNALLQRLLASNKELKTELALIKTSNEKTAKNTGSTDNTLTRVSRGGVSIATKAES